MKCSYNAKLMNLCKKGQLKHALVLVDEMIENKVNLSHHNFSALIHGAIKSNEPKQYKSIWNNFINKYHIKPNHITYSLAISAASRCDDIKTVKKFANEIQNNYKTKMNDKTWNQLIDSFGRINDIDAMFDIYNTMKYTKYPPDCCTISSLLNGCIKSKRFDKFEILLNEILKSKESIAKYVDHIVLVCIIDGITKNGQHELIESIWNKVIKYGIKPNINCYGTAVIAASKIKDRYNAHKLVNKFIESMKTEHIKDMNYDRCWNQILIGYSNLCKYDKMWMEYEEMKEYITPNAITFSILTNNCNDKYYQIKALNEAKQYISKWSDLTHKELKGFYRIARNVGDIQLMDILHPILESIHKNIDVFAELICDNHDNVWFDNFYKFEDSNILKKVDDLIKEINHKIDIDQHWEISSILAQRLISYHAEKKALAFALNKGISDIVIKLSLRICMDCHRFFCSVSQLYYTKQIIVIDPKTTHNFKNGQCSCGKS